MRSGNTADYSSIAEAVTDYNRGNRDSFDYIYGQTMAPLRKYAMYLSKDEYMAEDLLQDTYVRIIEKIDTLKESVTFMAWARAIMYNLAVSYYRKSKREFACEDDALYALKDAEVTSEDPEELCERNETAEIVDEAVSSLPEKQEAAVREFYYDLKSVSWIASTDNSSEGTIKTRLFYARNRLKTALGVIN